MKNYKVIALGLLAAASAGFTACSDHETYDVYGNDKTYVYVAPTAPKLYTGQVLHTPVGHFGEVKASIPVKIQYLTSRDINVSARADNSMVEEYNEKNNTEFAEIPESVISALLISSTTIKADTIGAGKNIEVEIPASAFAELTEPEYILPIRINVDNCNCEVYGSEDLGIAYIKVTTSGDYVTFAGNTTATNAIVRTPVGASGEIKSSFTPKLVTPVGTNLSATLKPAMNMVAEYNAKNSTNYKALPDNIVSALEIGSTTIAAGNTAADGSISVTAPSEHAQELTEPAYILPLQLVTTFDGSSAEAQEKYAYLIVTSTFKLVHANADVADIDGTMIPVADMASWTAEGANINTIKDNSTNTTWGDGTYTIDMGEVKDFAAVSCSARYSNYGSTYTNTSIRVQLSEDGSTWTDCGTLSKDEMTLKSNYRYYVLYGTAKARYIKLTLATQYGFGTGEIRVYEKK